MLQKACIKIVARAIYTYLFFSYTYTLLFCRNKKVAVSSANYTAEHCSIILLFNYMLQDYSSERTGFNMINKRHAQPVAYTMLV